MNKMPLQQDLTQQVLDRTGSGTDARLRQVIEALVVHLHEFVREIALTEAEWRIAIEFLTQTGQKCVGGRQEFILLSDVLGVSMLVDAINHRRPPGATESTVFGPFYTGEQPLHPDGGTILKKTEAAPPLSILGRVRSITGEPLEGALIEIWQVDGKGLYDVQDPTIPSGHMRASFRTLKDGSFSFVTIRPVTYSIPTDGPVGLLLAALGREAQRPAHIHFMVSAIGHERLVTHLFAAGDVHMDRDAVFGVKQGLIVNMDGAQAEVEFVLTPGDAVEDGPFGD
jgi:catechol 1,2-dioxygenase